MAPRSYLYLKTPNLKTSAKSLASPGSGFKVGCISLQCNSLHSKDQSASLEGPIGHTQVESVSAGTSRAMFASAHGQIGDARHVVSGSDSGLRPKVFRIMITYLPSMNCGQNKQSLTVTTTGTPQTALMNRFRPFNSLVEGILQVHLSTT